MGEYRAYLLKVFPLIDTCLRSETKWNFVVVLGMCYSSSNTIVPGYKKASKQVHEELVIL